MLSLLIAIQLVAANRDKVLGGSGRLVRRCQEAAETDSRCRTWLAPTFMLAGASITLVATALEGIAATVILLLGMAVAYLLAPYLQAQANPMLGAGPEVTRRTRGFRLVVLAAISVLWACIALPVTVLGGAGLLKPYKVSAGSMEPTFRCGDRFLVESFTERSDHPRRGDVVAFHPPAGIGVDGAPDPAIVRTEAAAGGRVEVVPSDVTYVKRVIGLPGDTVELRNHRAVVNGEELDEPYVLTAESSFDGMADREELEVPSDTYFVLGDHRDNSADSRMFGFVPQAFVIGRVVWVYWPPARFGAPSDDADRSYADGGPDLACLEGIAQP